MYLWTCKGSQVGFAISVGCDHGHTLAHLVHNACKRLARSQGGRHAEIGKAALAKVCTFRKGWFTPLHRGSKERVRDNKYI